MSKATASIASAISVRTPSEGILPIAFVELLKTVLVLKFLMLEPFDAVECFNQPFDCHSTQTYGVAALS